VSGQCQRLPLGQRNPLLTRLTTSLTQQQQQQHHTHISANLIAMTLQRFAGAATGVLEAAPYGVH
jgi:hypothetical protein